MKKVYKQRNVPIKELSPQFSSTFFVLLAVRSHQRKKDSGYTVWPLSRSYPQLYNSFLYPELFKYLCLQNLNYKCKGLYRPPTALQPNLQFLSSLLHLLCWINIICKLLQTLWIIWVSPEFKSKPFLLCTFSFCFYQQVLQSMKYYCSHMLTGWSSASSVHFQFSAIAPHDNTWCTLWRAFYSVPLPVMHWNF